MPVTVKHRQFASGRSAVPLVFVTTLVVLGAASTVSETARWLLAAELGLYGACVLVFAAAALRQRRESWRLFPRVAALFPTFHVAHGLGALHGWVRAARAALTRAR